jgi:hypothetical protein
VIHALLFAAAMSRWIVVDDIHLDPFFREQTVYGAGDTTPVLWAGAVRAMRAEVPDARVVVLGGDELAHLWGGLARAAHADPEAAALATMRRIADDLGAAYPHAQFIVALGNNDDPCGDYASESGGRYLAALERIWEPLVDRNGAAPHFRDEFMRGGYYGVRLPDGERAVVLNTVLWSAVARSGCTSDTSGAGAAELAWFDRTLAALPAAERAVPVMHVPPGYDARTTTELGELFAMPFLNSDDNRALLSVLARNRERIPFALAAHTHHYDFRVAAGVPMLLASSISPVYGNLPAFYELDVSGGRLRDVVPYTYDPHGAGVRFTAREPFDAMYGIAAFDAPALQAAAARIRTDEPTRATWLRALAVWGVKQRGSWLPSACAQTELEGGFSWCAGVAQRQLSIGAVALLCLAAGVALLVRGLRRRVDRRA